MRVLVLGGTGAMGEPLVKILNERGVEVYVTSRRKLESKENIHFIQGDAHDMIFIEELLKVRYDVIVDFVVYSTEAFQERVNFYLKSTDQYMFLSSARVYADSKVPIKEDSPRLLDVCKDEEYLKTDEYALAKARAEDVLFNSESKNWTIIRPYITYNTKRLQLGGLELGAWASRVQEYNAARKNGKINNFYIVLPKDIAYKQTTMTYGEDVARAIVDLIGNPMALGEAFHITGEDHMRWIDVANIYCTVIQEIKGITPKLYMPENSCGLSKCMGNYYQIKYDRMYDRLFDYSKLLNACRNNAKRLNFSDSRACIQLDFRTMNDGLRECFGNYLKISDSSLLPINFRYEAFIDRNVYKTRLLTRKNFTNKRDSMKYLAYLFFPDALPEIKRMLKTFRP